MQEPVQEPVQEPIQEPVEFQQLENQSLYDRMSVIEEKITELNENNATFSKRVV